MTIIIMIKTTTNTMASYWSVYVELVRKIENNELSRTFNYTKFIHEKKEQIRKKSAKNRISHFDGAFFNGFESGVLKMASYLYNPYNNSHEGWGPAYNDAWTAGYGLGKMIITYLEQLE